MAETSPLRPVIWTWAKRLAVTLGAVSALLWAAWVSHAATREPPPRIVTVRLAETIGTFVEAEARAGGDPAAAGEAALAYLEAAEAAVAEMGTDGRIVLVAEAVLAGDAEDATPELEARIARRLKSGARP
jgi:hypothetical protein